MSEAAEKAAKRWADQEAGEKPEGDLIIALWERERRLSRQAFIAGFHWATCLRGKRIQNVSYDDVVKQEAKRDE